jgi:hypothetical protein
MYTLTREPEDELYRKLLDEALPSCPTALLVVRQEMPLAARGARVLDLGQLRPLLQEASEATEWPGTRLFGGTALVYRFSYDAESSTILKEAATRLFEWLQPNLPEDLCLLKPSGEPWLASIAHERDAYFSLDAPELENLARSLPEIRRLIRNDVRSTNL